MAPFGLPVVPEVYISVQGSSRSTVDVGPAVARGGEQILIGAIAGGAVRLPKTIKLPRGHRQLGAHGLDGLQQFVLNDERLRVAVLDDVLRSPARPAGN